MTELHSFDDAMEIVDRLAEIADEDLELVAKALHRHTLTHGREIVVDVDAAALWISREIDGRAFDH